MATRYIATEVSLFHAGKNVVASGFIISLVNWAPLAASFTVNECQLHNRCEKWYLGTGQLLLPGSLLCANGVDFLDIVMLQARPVSRLVSTATTRWQRRFSCLGGRANRTGGSSSTTWSRSTTC